MQTSAAILHNVCSSLIERKHSWLGESGCAERERYGGINEQSVGPNSIVCELFVKGAEQPSPILAPSPMPKPLSATASQIDAVRLVVFSNRANAFLQLHVRLPIIGFDPSKQRLKVHRHAIVNAPSKIYSRVEL